MIRKTTPGIARRQRRQEAKRVELVNAAIALLDRRGPEGLTMPALAAEVEAAVGGLYRYFPSKEALLVAVRLRAAADLADLLEARLATAGADPLDRIRVAFGTWAAWAERSPTLWASLDHGVSDPRVQLHDDDARRVDAAVAPILARCAALLLAAAEAGALTSGDAALRTLVLWSAVRGACHLRKRDGRAAPGPNAAAVEACAVEGLLAGWSVR